MKRLAWLLLLLCLLIPAAAWAADGVIPDLGAYAGSKLTLDTTDDLGFAKSLLYRGNDANVKKAATGYIQLLQDKYDFDEIAHFEISEGETTRYYWGLEYTGKNPSVGSFRQSGDKFAIKYCQAFVEYSQSTYYDGEYVKLVYRSELTSKDTGDRLSGVKATAKPTTKPKVTAKPTAKPKVTATPKISGGTKKCTACGGDGKVSRSCSSCGGDGKNSTRCANCGGDGKRDCMSCAGKGYNSCSGCGGTGERRCGSCYGTGTSGSRRCTSCGGDGRKDCSSCTNGRKRCSACSGSGDRRCTYCSGSGQKESSCSSCGGDGRRESTCATCSGKVKK